MGCRPAECLTNFVGADHVLDAPTGASRQFTFICCKQVDAISDLALSPRGDTIAGTRTGGTDGHAIEFVILDVEGTGSRSLPLPAGVTRIQLVSWSPDGSALLASGCRPCNKAVSPTERQTAEHGHLYIVPLDGSPARELLDDNNGALGGSWSPDASILTVAHYACPPGAFMPRCGPYRATLGLVASRDGTETPLTTETQSAEQPAWSPDGQRFAFVSGDAGDVLDHGGVFVANADGSNIVKLADTSNHRAPIWSPDGRWLLYPPDWQSPNWWVVSVDGGDARRLGAFGGVAW
jgi:Tol biopolymer transport system component